jgi:hypothetical protein
MACGDDDEPTIDDQAPVVADGIKNLIDFFITIIN